jgi:hypothetical protein
MNNGRSHALLAPKTIVDADFIENIDPIFLDGQVGLLDYLVSTTRTCHE